MNAGDFAERATPVGALLLYFVWLWLVAGKVTARRGGRRLANFARCGLFMQLIHGAGLVGVTLTVQVAVSWMGLALPVDLRTLMEQHVLVGIGSVLICGAGLAATGWFPPRPRPTA